jgi:hypothetical protein
MRDLIHRKNGVLQEIERRKAAHNGDGVIRLSKDAARLEGEIAAGLIQAGRLGDAAVNLISRGSCLVDAGEARLARRALEQAEYLMWNPRTFDWVLNELDRIGSAQSTTPPDPDKDTERLEALARSAIVNLAQKEVRTKTCTYPSKYWRRAKEIAIADLPGVSVEIICSRCGYCIDADGQRAAGAQRIVCGSCGNDVSR